jgi:integrase
VPSDLVPLFGRVEIHRSLCVDDGRVARAIARTIRAKAEEEFAVIRQRRLLGATDQELQDAARTFYAQALPVTRTATVARIAYGASGDGARKRTQRLSEAVNAFIEDRKPLWQPKTELMHGWSLRLLVRIVGDKLLRAISRKDCRVYRDTLAQLPPNMSKRFEGMSIAEVIARKPAPMNAKTVNGHTAVVVALFNWCCREGLVSDNPARGLALPLSRRADTEREAFSDADVLTIFHGLSTEKDARYWIPRIAAYSGMRLEEIAQLHTRDVRQEADVWVLDVNAGDGKKLKNEQSKRLVPIHPALLELGILEHRNRAAAIGDGRMWSDLQRGKDGFYSSPFSKWFGRYKRRVGVVSSKLTFHSFRHAVINQLKQGGVSELVIKELVGHTNNSITTARYGKRFEPQRMCEVVNLIAYKQRAS